MNKEERLAFARMESKLDMLESERVNLDTILRKSGFSEGINTLKKTVEELLEEVRGEDTPDLDVDGLFA